MKLEAISGPSIPVAAYQLLSIFRRTLLRYEQDSAYRIKAGGLTTQQYVLLTMIAGSGIQIPSIGEVAEALHLSHNSAVELSQRAEKAGLLIRRRDPEQGRRTLLSLTPEGLLRLEMITRRLITELGHERLEMQESLTRWRTLLDSGIFEAALHGRTSIPSPLNFTLRPAALHDQSLVWNLLQLHLHELSAYHHVDISQEGHYAYPPFERYWQGGRDQPYLLDVGGHSAGFVLLSQFSAQRYALQEFFLLRKFQAQGLGFRVVRQLLSARPGEWSVGYHTDNLGACHFWQRLLQDLCIPLPAEQDSALPLGRGKRLTFSVPLDS